MNEINLWLYVPKVLQETFFLIFSVVWFQKLSIPPPQKGFFLWTPLPPNLSQASHINT